MVADDDNSRICPLCATRAFATFRFGLLRCSGCGLVVDPAIFRPGAAEALNEDAFGEAYHTERSFWVRAFENVKNRRYLANLRRAGVTGIKLLEVGVGTGAFPAARARSRSRGRTLRFVCALVSAGPAVHGYSYTRHAARPTTTGHVRRDGTFAGGAAAC